MAADLVCPFVMMFFLRFACGCLWLETLLARVTVGIVVLEVNENVHNLGRELENNKN